MDLIFYNEEGDPFSITAREWEELFQAAVGAGWCPAGTLPPAIPFDMTGIGSEPEEPWNRGYLKARGQRVERSDAQRLAAALRVLEPATPTASHLAGYCERGGFLMFPGHGPSLGSQLLSMNKALRAVEGAGGNVLVPVSRSLRK